MLYLHGLVRFTSQLSLEEVALLNSERLCGGARFIESREFDEVPGVSLQKNILMLAIRICGRGPDYGLHIDTEFPVYPEEEETDFPKLEIVNLAAYVAKASERIEQIQILPT